MAQIEITENQYNTTCDTYGCSNIAKHVIGKIGEGQAQKTLYCDECLQGIINNVPIEMILARPELAEVDDVGKALEGGEEEVSLIDLKFNSLKEMAVMKGITVPFGISKDELIKLIEGK